MKGSAMTAKLVALPRHNTKEIVNVNPDHVDYVVECDPSFDTRFCTIQFTNGTKITVAGTSDQVCRQLGIEIKR